MPIPKRINKFVTVIRFLQQMWIEAIPLQHMFIMFETNYQKRSQPSHTLSFCTTQLHRLSVLSVTFRIQGQCVCKRDVSHKELTDCLSTARMRAVFVRGAGIVLITRRAVIFLFFPALFVTRSVRDSFLVISLQTYFEAET